MTTDYQYWLWSNEDNIILVTLKSLLIYEYDVTGLPLDTTDEEFIEMMSKYGIIMQDPDTSKLTFT